MKLFLVALLGLLAIPAFADVVAVTNASFEMLPASPTLNPCPSPTGCSYTTADVTPIIGWTASVPSAAGQFDPGVSAGNTTYYDSVPNGNWVAYLNAGDLTQTVGSTVQADTIYTLTVSEGLRNDYPTLGTAELVIDGNSYVATGTAPTAGNWSTYTAVYNSALHPGDVGSTITIELLDNTANPIQAGFDNVVLTKASMPEASSIAELATMLGMLGLGLTVWRRRRA